MASDGSSGQIPSTSLLQGSQANNVVGNSSSGKTLPPDGNTEPAGSSAIAPVSTSPSKPESAGLTQTASPPPPRASDTQRLVELLNKHLNTSGRPDQFRVDPAASAFIQEINPSNGAVVGEFSAEEFPALARSIGASGLVGAAGLILNSRA